MTIHTTVAGLKKFCHCCIVYFILQEFGIKLILEEQKISFSDVK